MRGESRSGRPRSRRVRPTLRSLPGAGCRRGRAYRTHRTPGPARLDVEARKVLPGVRNAREVPGAPLDARPARAVLGAVGLVDEQVGQGGAIVQGHVLAVADQARRL